MVDAASVATLMRPCAASGPSSPSLAALRIGDSFEHDRLDRIRRHALHDDLASPRDCIAETEM